MSKKPASAPPICRSNIHDLVPYVPGKPIEEVEREYGITDIIKLASNENPYGPSPRVVEAMKEALESIRLYPDGSCFSLTQRLSQHLDLPADHIVVGNGSDESSITWASPTWSRGRSGPGTPLVRSLRGGGDPEWVPVHQVPLKDYTHDLDAMADAVTPRRNSFSSPTRTTRPAPS